MHQEPLRQVHLDFHTSPWINDVAADFDAKAFAKTIADAHIDSVTLFAKCHHGYAYFPSRTAPIHPGMAERDLLGEQIEALKSAGVRVRLYTTIGWEERIAAEHPEWRQMKKDGTFATVLPDPANPTPAPWKMLNYIHPDYQDHFEDHLRELIERYEFDGFFLDIVFIAEGCCWSEESIKFREKHGLMSDDPETAVRFESEALGQFTGRMTRFIQGLNQNISPFYNGNNRMYSDSTAGYRRVMVNDGNLEVESLPGGFWGYYHFPKLARFVAQQGKPWIGMTGRFQKMWGDFGGIKPVPALEYECFRSQAHGGGNSVGDQLPPRGVLDPAAYELTGIVYKQCAEAEPFYESSEAHRQIGIFASNYPGLDFDQAQKTDEGAILLSEELHYDAAYLDDACDLHDYQLLILADSTVITDALKPKLADFYNNGGKLILSHKAGFDKDGNWALDFLPLTFHGDEPLYDTYWRARADFAPGMETSDRVCYSQGIRAKGGSGTEVLIDRVLPYFKRSALKYSSHFQTPPVKEADEYPAAIAGERFIYFADPIFREYRQSGNKSASQFVKLAMQRLIGDAPFGKALPPSVLMIPRKRGNDLILSLLRYIPVRKALDIDVIDERMPLTGLPLHMPENVTEVLTYPDNQPLSRANDGAFILPPSEGRTLLYVKNYFE